MKSISLSRGLTALVDYEDFDRVSQYKWYAAKRGKSYYPARSSKEGFVYLHRFVLNAQEGHNVDHINGDTLDNRRENLRFATQQQNTYNRHRTTAKSGVLGVLLDQNAAKNRRGSKPWRAYLSVGRKRIHVGWFPTRDEAIEARRKASAALHGEFSPQETRSRYA